ncbi:S8 family serine peptidase [Fictibacillus nanhaiensis]|uniref:S8 family serine peptidase n=1 Tax=Fictibacillus nanhaiensis TaxID=742169 RepID=UPI00203CEFB9|nr:S8 family serine peptidase [Fictibacillus nanhaiensis]MCM3733439.1 S8 family serine peptidase [Fictibacillus nanhaiensis]
MNKWHKTLASLGLSVTMIGSSFAPVFAESDNYSVKKSSIPVSELFKPGNRVKENPYNLAKKQDQLSKTTLLVKYNKTLTTGEHKKAGATLQRRMTSLKYDVVKINSGKKLEDVMKNYSKLGKVDIVSPSANLVKLGTTDPKVSESYHLSLLNVDKAQTIAGKNKVRVAVIDTGIDSKHPELKNKLLPSYNAVNPMNQGVPDFHGTHVAGIIASEKGNGVGGYGVNPNVEILPIDVFDRGWGASDYVIADAIMYAVEKNAKVINMSLGSIFPSPLIQDAVAKAIAADVTIVAAAGNEGMNLNSYPAAFEGVISVGSTNKDNLLSSYSTYGPSVDVVAPGEDVYAPLYDYEKKSTFYKLSGTSMSSPVVAGVASLLLSKNPNLKPKQIEYILEHSTKDLGPAGYDTKYANGLVDPVKALSFDVSKIPSSVYVPKSKASLLKAAEKVDLSKKLVKEGTIKKAYEEQFIQFPVKKGEYIQTVLGGSADYDYKFTYYLAGKGIKPLQKDVNKTLEGKSEGHLYEVPEDGSLVIGVSDVNGNYNADGKSAYKLSVEKFDRLLEDTNTRENPVAVEAFPFVSEGEGDWTFTGHDGDSDFYSFKTEEPQIVKVELGGVAGIDSTISLKMIEPWPEDMPEDIPAEEMPPMEHEMDIVNQKPTGEGEVLTFEAMPGMEYVVEVDNHTPGFFFPMSLLEDGSAQREYPYSHVPYSLSIDAKSVSEDEDGFPMGEHLEEEYMEGDMDVEEYVAKRNDYKKNHHDSMYGEDDWMEEEKAMLERIREAALEYDPEAGAEGYFQYSGDEDFYKLNVEESAILEFDLSASEAVPAMEIMKIMEFEGGYTTLVPVATNITWGFFDIETKDKFVAGLQSGEEYFIRVMHPNYQPSFDKYSFTSKVLVENPEDKHEPNNDIENTPVKDMPAETVRGNYAMNADYDAYYVKAKTNGLYGVHYKPIAPSKQMQEKYSKDLLKPIDGLVAVLEDTNGNRILDPEEYGSARVYDKGWDNEPEQGSFQAKAGKGYFVIADQWIWDFPSPNLNEYELTVKPVNTKDEDAGSVVKNNVPSKPIALKRNSTKEWESKGYLNAGVANGDTDWYTFSFDKSHTGQITFSNEMIDGVISLYDSKGKLVATSDTYALGDAEVLNYNIKGGKYYIKVTDGFGRATLTPYSLKMKID